MSDNIIQFPERKSVTELKRLLFEQREVLADLEETLIDLQEKQDAVQAEYQYHLQLLALREGIQGIPEELLEFCSYVGYIVENDEMQITFIETEDSTALRGDEE